MELTNIINKLESYLLDTRQINRLAIRQARILSRHVTHENRVEEMRIVLLLCLAALHKGVPRADTVFLMKPLDPAIVGQHAKNIDTRPDWAELLIDPATFSGIKTLLENLVQNPEILRHCPANSGAGCGHYTAPYFQPEKRAHRIFPLLVCRGQTRK